MTKILLSSLLCLMFVVACKKNDIVEATPVVILSDREIVQKYLNLDINAFPNYINIAYPVHFRPNVIAGNNTPAMNPVTDAGATLGRVLFFDKSLSINGKIACATCHDQAKGFTDDATLSKGFLGGLTGAHSMRLANTNFYTDAKMFWDKRAATLEDQVTQPIRNEVEMGFTAAIGIDSLVRKLNKLPYYPVLFNKAFNSTTITEAKMQFALAQYIRSMVSKSSKFDNGFAQVFNRNTPNGDINVDFPNYTAQENIGKTLFLTGPGQGGGGCQGCHAAPTFALTPNTLSNGLDAIETRILKSPSLKNVAAAGGYMHDGRFQTLAQVVEHYNSGIKTSPSLDPRLRTPNGQPSRLNFTQAQKDALVAFLNTLTDTELMADTKFGNPFK
jgi:cytochrome c peroxidase